MLLEHRTQRRRVADVDLVKCVPRVLDRAGERLEIAGVRQAIDVDDAVLGLLDELANQCRSDEAGAAGNEICGHYVDVKEIAMLRRANGAES